MSFDDKTGTITSTGIFNSGLGNDNLQITTETSNVAKIYKKHKFDVDKVLQLANLTASDKERELYSGQLDQILDYIEQLNQDTKDVEPTFNVGNLSNVERKDEVEAGLTQEQALQNAKSKDKGFFKVKAIFEER